ncbi:iron chelate uptake ABC transporter family permease subunit [Nocardia sp. AG03]|uniref:iron chelate uptake ABC transporter family permease subunit n=1 Tax=Nocardia sp. AG03 TaxID=3025312 RepID=UPI00241857EE|nr:iron chelate uptake ABC transporter family permease subunit [Nocardia sp. AG03]
MAILCLLVSVSLCVGARGIAPDTVLDALRGVGSGEDFRIVRDLRVPRTVAGVAAGLGLGVAGAIIQALTRNPLADPGLLGVNAGAAVAVTLAVGVFGSTAPTAYVWFALGGAGLIAALVYVLGSAGRGVDPVRLVLAGVALAAVLGGIVTAITLLNPDAFAQMRAWNAGTLVGRDLGVLRATAPFLGLGILVALLLGPALSALALGDDAAAGLGASVRRTRALSIAAITLLAGAATAIAGPIVFVGLMIPHAARWLVGTDQRWILLLSGLLAPSLLLLADVVGRLVMRPAEVPVGIVTAVLGGPMLMMLARRRTAVGR